MGRSIAQPTLEHGISWRQTGLEDVIVGSQLLKHTVFIILNPPPHTHTYAHHITSTLMQCLPFSPVSFPFGVHHTATNRGGH